MIESWLKAIEAHDKLAAWVQAFGSLAALGVAIWVGNNQARRTERSQKHQREEQQRGYDFGVISACFQAKAFLDESYATLRDAEEGVGYLAYTQAEFQDLADLVLALISTGQANGMLIGPALEVRRAVLDAKQVVTQAVADLARDHPPLNLDPAFKSYRDAAATAFEKMTAKRHD